jgi:fused signal recognition particle receptor
MIKDIGGNMALSFFSKLKEGLEKTRKGITDKIDDLFTRYGEIDDDLFEELEEILITADVGMQTTMKLIDMLKEELRIRKIKEASAVKDVFKDVVEKLLVENGHTAFDVGNEPTIIMVIGVNGVGKTTSIGKIANLLKAQGKSVLIAAGDTFRAAAIDQLKVWGDRVGVSVIHQSEGSDPAAVIFDTAGRLHNKVNLMNELSKVFRVIDREYPEAKKEVLLVLDATTGQNAVQQAKVFNEAAEISGIVLTKLDGTAKGGVVLAISSELQIPVKLIGVGEGIDDLQQFNPHDFAEALMGSRNA